MASIPPYQEGLQRANNRGVIVLVLGILGWTGFGFILGIPAWILGNGYLKDVREGRVAGDEVGLAQVGRILGMIITILSACALMVYLVFFVFIIGLFASAGLGGAAAFNPNTMGPLGHHANRQSLLDAVVYYRTKHPEKNYEVIANELTKANGKKVGWYSEPIKPVDGCGKYSFTAKGGMLTVTDSCGQDYIYGWPAQRT